jgi:hypothetical protein
MGDLSHFESHEPAAAYAWMRDQMRQRIGAPITDFLASW